MRSTEKQAESWEDLPADIKNTYDKLGIPEAEKQRLVAGVAAQYESEVVYHQIREDLEEQGVIFLDTDTALKEHPELFQEYFGTVIPVGDNKFASLNTAVWSGGSFIYVPKGVHVEIPLQAYFRINTENMGQFERTLIIVDEDAYVHYVEGCTAPIYSSDSLHSAVVEIIVKKGGRCRYTTIQNWSNNVYNLVTKRAVAYEGATMEWVDGNIGSKVTMKYPAVYLMGEHAKGETLSIAFAGEGQHQDAGAKMVHMAPNTSSNIVSKSVARGGGRTSYRGLIEIGEGSQGRQVQRAVRRAAGRHHLPLGHLPLRRRPRGRRVDGPRGDRLQGQRGPALLPDEPRHDRVRGDGDDRARLRRADRARAADGVRAGAQPADRAADGGLGRLTPTPSQPSDSTPTQEESTYDSHGDEPFRRAAPPTVPSRWASPRNPADARVERAAASLTTWPTSPCRTAARRTGGSPRWTGCAACTTAPRSRPAALQGRGRPPRTGVTVETVGRDDARLGRAGKPVDRVAAQAYSSFEKASVVTVPKDAVLTEPVRIVVHGEGGVSYAHQVVEVEPFAEAVVVIDHTGDTVLGRQRRVRARRRRQAHRRLRPGLGRQRRARRPAHRAGRPGRHASSRWSSPSAATWCGCTRGCGYAAPGGEAELFGLYFTDNGQHQEHRLFIDHEAPHCRSNVAYKGALQGEDAHAVWIGDVLIRAGAEGTDTYELNRNLVLTDGARVDSVPNLEIETGEIVGAGHASATGRFDDEQLFYLMARGIPADEARRLVVRGFFAELVQQIGVADLQERLLVKIEQELEASTG